MPAPNKTKATVLNMRKKHWLAIEYRYLGMTYPEIAAKITEAGDAETLAAETVRRWFMAGGMLEHMYIVHSQQESERRRRLAVHELQKTLVKIPIIMDEILERKDPMTGGRKHDKILVETIKELNRMLGFPGDGSNELTNPIDQYFDRLEDEIDTDEQPTPKPATAGGEGGTA